MHNKGYGYTNARSSPQIIDKHKEFQNSAFKVRKVLPSELMRERSILWLIAIRRNANGFCDRQHLYTWFCFDFCSVFIVLFTLPLVLPVDVRHAVLTSTIFFGFKK